MKQLILQLAKCFHINENKSSAGPRRSLQARAPKRRFHLELERLEDRQLLSTAVIDTSFSATLVEKMHAVGGMMYVKNWGNLPNPTNGFFDVLIDNEQIEVNGGGSGSPS